jgi:hypothetical protein
MAVMSLGSAAGGRGRFAVVFGGAAAVLARVGLRALKL